MVFPHAEEIYKGNGFSFSGSGILFNVFCTTIPKPILELDTEEVEEKSDKIINTN